MKRVSLGALVLACALSAGSAAAQTDPRDTGNDGRGLMLGINLVGNSLASQRDDGGFTSRGAGLGVTVGYGINPNVTLFARSSVAYLAGSMDVGARYTFRSPSAALRPYVEVAASRTASTANGMDSHGYGVTAAAGVEYALARNLSIDVGLAHAEGRFSAGALDGRRFAGTRVNLGIRWNP